MPLIRDYNGDSNIYGLKGHSTFMSVCKFQSFMKRNLRSSHTNSFSRKPLLPTRPSATKHSPNRRTVHHRQDFEARNIQAGQQSRRGLQQRLEHPTATSLLPLRCFQVVHIPRLHTQIKSNHQGRVSLASAKPDPPSGARRGEPPPRQNFPRKKSLCQNVFRAFRLLR
jgi:hypothetical protein